MDISSDSTLIVTGSVDRNIKIWGLDFGDCHKSIFAHDDSVTGIQFVPNTHYFFSCGKDGKVKQWDADNFQKIIKIDVSTCFYCFLLSFTLYFLYTHDKSSKCCSPLIVGTLWRSMEFSSES